MSVVEAGHTAGTEEVGETAKLTTESTAPIIPETIIRFTDHGCMDPDMGCSQCNPGSFS